MNGQNGAYTPNAGGPQAPDAQALFLSLKKKHARLRVLALILAAAFCVTLPGAISNWRGKRVPSAPSNRLEVLEVQDYFGDDRLSLPYACEGEANGLVYTRFRTLTFDGPEHIAEEVNKLNTGTARYEAKLYGTERLLITKRVGSDMPAVYLIQQTNTIGQSSYVLHGMSLSVLPGPFDQGAGAEPDPDADLADAMGEDSAAVTLLFPYHLMRSEIFRSAQAQAESGVLYLTDYRREDFLAFYEGMERYIIDPASDGFVLSAYRKKGSDVVVHGKALRLRFFQIEGQNYVSVSLPLS